MLRHDLPWSRSPHAWLGRAAAAAVLAAVGLLAVGLRPHSESAAQAAQEPAAQSGSANPSRTAASGEPLSREHIASSAIGVLAVRPAALTQLPELQPLAKAFEQAQLTEESLGIPLNQFDQVTVVFFPRPGRPNAGPTGATLVRTREPNQTDQVLRAYLGESTTVDLAGNRRVYTAGRYAACQLDARTVAVSPVNDLREYLNALDKPGEPSWSDRWPADGSVVALSLIDLEPIRTEMDAELQRAPREQQVLLNTLRPLWLETDLFTLALHWQSGPRLEAAAYCKSAASAERVEETATAARTLVLNMIPTVLEQAERRPPAPQEQFLVDLLRFTMMPLQGAEIQVKGQQCTATLALDRDQTAGVVNKLVPAILAARKAAQQATAINNLRQIALAFHNYHDAYGHFPPPAVLGPDGQTTHSWRVAILPFLEQQALYETYRKNEPWNSPNNLKVLQAMPSVYRAPDADASTNSSYYLVTGPETMYPELTKGTRIQSIRDGTSNTIMVVEAAKDIPWTKPEDIPFDPATILKELRGSREGGFAAALADGSARVISKDIDPKTLKALFSADGREVIRDF